MTVQDVHHIPSRHEVQGDGQDISNPIGKIGSDVVRYQACPRSRGMDSSTRRGTLKKNSFQRYIQETLAQMVATSCYNIFICD